MPKQRRSPLVRSVTVLRLVATAITMLSLGGMSVYASGHLHNTAAPLQPRAAQTPAPTTTTSTRTTTGRIQLSADVPTTTARPLTTTHRS